MMHFDKEMKIQKGFNITINPPHLQYDYPLELSGYFLTKWMTLTRPITAPRRLVSICSSYRNISIQNDMADSPWHPELLGLQRALTSTRESILVQNEIFFHGYQSITKGWGIRWSENLRYPGSLWELSPTWKIVHPLRQQIIRTL